MTQIMVEVTEETLKHLHSLAALHPKLTISQIAGQVLDAQVAYRLEVERMKPPSSSFGTDSPPFGATY